MNIPSDLQYTEHDEWIRVEGTTLTVGISDYAQDQLGEIVHVELPEVGAELSAGDAACEVESVKAVAEVYTPVSGTVVAVNDALDDEPEKLNEDPYGAWLFKIEASGTLSGTMGAEAYAAKVG
jgi:glycine cleavage system H protein